MAENPLSEFHRDLPIAEPPEYARALLQGIIVQARHTWDWRSRLLRTNCNITEAS